MLTVAALLLAACSSPVDSGGTPPIETKGAATPDEAVESVVDAIEEGDFSRAGQYAMPDQAALAALAEGASFPDVAEALRDGDSQIAANFWSGFAQGASGALTGTVSYIEDQAQTRDAVEFQQLIVTGGDGTERVMWTRDVDGYRVDIFASFGAGLADKMLGPVERLLTAQTDDTLLILTKLAETAPSLQVAANSETVSTAARQQILALIELITRVG